MIKLYNHAQIQRERERALDYLQHSFEKQKTDSLKTKDATYQDINQEN